MKLPTWEALERYLFVQRGLKQSNKSHYKGYYKNLECFLGGKDFTLDNCISYIGHLQDKKYSNNHINNQIKCIRNIGRMVGVRWTEEIQYRQRQQKAYKTLSVAQFRKVLKTHPKRSRDARRVNFRFDVALETAFMCGLRCGELVGLQWQDVRPYALTIRNTKNGVDRVLPITKGHYKRLMKLKEFEWGGDYVFGFRSKPLYRNSINKELKTRLKLAGMEGYITRMHDLRHSFATILADQGIDIAKIKPLMGHKDIASTDIYVHMSPERLRTVIDEHPYNKPSIELLKKKIEEFTQTLDKFDCKTSVDKSDSKIELKIEW